MQTSQSAQSPSDNAPKKVSLADGGSSANTLSFPLLNVVLFSCSVVLFSFGFFSGPFKSKGKRMTKLMKVCIGNNQRVDFLKIHMH